MGAHPHAYHLLSPPCCCPQTALEHLLLWQPRSPMPPLGDSGLSVLGGMVSLKELRIDGADGLTDRGWQHFCGSHTQLTRLHLTAVRVHSLSITYPLTHTHSLSPPSLTLHVGARA
jgi:hypothetical protein